LNPGIEATACACEILYVYVYVYVYYSDPKSSDHAYTEVVL